MPSGPLESYEGRDYDREKYGEPILDAAETVLSTLGTLPVCIGNASKIIEYMHFCGKEYVAVAELHRQVSREVISDVLGMFTGEIYQRPPLRSSVARRVRRRTIYYIDQLEVEDRRVLLRIGCESGTYIRKLIHDIGLVLGVGAHMAELRRTRDGALREGESFTLYDVAEAVQELRESKGESRIRKVIRPLEEALQLLPSVYIKDSAVDAVCHGASVSVKGISKLDTPFSGREPVVVKSLKSLWEGPRGIPSGYCVRRAG